MDKYLRVDVALAIVVALLVLAAGYFVDHNGDIDELGLFNPSYMLQHYGKLTYPVHGYFDEPVIVHPPIHVGFIGLLLKLGLNWYYSEATPTVLWFLLSLVIIVFSPFPLPVRLGLLFAVGVLVSTSDWLADMFLTRPEGEVHSAWFAGLLLLESGRLRNWSRKPLFAGAALVTYAATLHYYAWPVLPGLAIYAIWVYRSRGWKHAKPCLVALAGGTCLVAVPFAVFYLIPHFTSIVNVLRATQGEGGISTSIRMHMEIYRAWVHDYTDLQLLISKPLSWGIPLFVFSTAGLILFRSIRGIALAALPWELAVYFLAAHKQKGYLIHEVFLFVAASCIVLLMAGDWLAGRAPWPWVRKVFSVAATLLLALYLVTDNQTLKAAKSRTQPGLQEGELARAACFQILGPRARVVGRVGAWYSSGAGYWHEVMSDILQEPKNYDPISYFSNFDAAADYYHRSGDPLNGDQTVSSWYAEGLLKLRGFYIGETNGELRLLLLNPTRPPQVVGYASKAGQLYRFEERAGGDYQVQSFVCPPSAHAAAAGIVYQPQIFSVFLELPKGTGSLVTTLSHPDSQEVAESTRACKQIVMIPGSLTTAEKQALLNHLHREDQPIQFPRGLEEVPGFHTTVPAPQRGAAIRPVPTGRLPRRSPTPRFSGDGRCLSLLGEEYSAG